MMLKIEINTGDLAKDLEKAVIEDLERGVAKATQYCCDRAKDLCPVDTGNLRNSISCESDGLEGCIYTNVEYAPYVEYGTSKMKEQPFMHPAIEDNVELITYIIEKELKD